MLEKRSAFLSPQILKLYEEIDPQLPLFLSQASDRQLDRDFTYARDGQRIAGGVAALCIAGFVYLVMQHHSTEAYWLLGTEAVGIILGFLRTRLDTILQPTKKRGESAKKRVIPPAT